ncbi:hypothetical protein KCU93_g9507, partial [Aureobasidium melanogenum]
MASKYVPSHITSSRNLALADAMSTTCATGNLEPLSLSNIHVSIDTDANPHYHYNPHNINPLGQSQSGHQTFHPTAAISHDIPTAPTVGSGLHTRIYDRSIGRYVRPMGPARSDSAIEARQSSSGHIEHMHGVDPLISRAPRPWYAVGRYLFWPDPLDHPLSLDFTALENSRLIPTQPQAPPSRLRPVRNVSRLVSLTEIASRFGLEQSALQTLNASVEKPGALKFIVLFEHERNDNHGCYRQLVVFAKVNLHLLPGHELPYPNQAAGEFEHEHNGHNKVFPDSDRMGPRSRAVSAASSSSDLLTPPPSAQSDTPPSLSNATKASELQSIAIFSQGRSSRQSKAFKFLGWYEIEETEFFAPNTSALVKTLEQRNGRASKEDLESEWAKISSLCDLIHPGSPDRAFIMGLWGGLFLAIVALFLPPLSVLKRTGCDHHLFINIVLTLFGWTPGILHAWYIILRFPDGRRAAELRDDVRQGRAKVVYQGYGLPAIGAGQPTQRIVVLQQQDPLKPHLLQQFQYHTKLQPEQDPTSDPDINDEKSPVAEEPLTTLYIEETGSEPVEAALETRLPEPIADGEPTSDEEWIPDGEAITVEDPARLSYSSTPYITEEARAW